MIPGENFQNLSNEELLAEYRKTNELAMKQELVLRYSYLVKTIALQMRGVYISFTEVDDIINEGIITLMNAIDNYDASHGAKLETYASLRIRGTIIDLARKHDWIPRSVKRRAKEIDKASSELYEKLGRAPEDEEIAAHLNISLDKYYKTQGDMNMYNVISLDSMVNEYQDSFNISPVSGTGNDEIIPGRVMEKEELSGVIVKAIENLNKREQLVISLYYQKELSMKEIAQVLGVTEARVSQLHSAAVRKMRTELTEYMN